MYSQVDQKGNTIALLDTIIDHRRDESAIRITRSSPPRDITSKSNGRMVLGSGSL